MAWAAVRPGMPASDATAHQFRERETTSYMVELPTQDWRAWKRQVPRTVPLYERLHDLIIADAAATERDGYDDMEERTARLLASRIQHRGRTAKNALDDGDIDKVRDEIDHMVDVATLFEE